jgi:hypothetical protein
VDDAVGCSDGSVTEAECKVLAANAGTTMSQVTFNSAVPPGCSWMYTNPTAVFLYNTDLTSIKFCGPENGGNSWRCYCAAKAPSSYAQPRSHWQGVAH